MASLADVITDTIRAAEPFLRGFVAGLPPLSALSVLDYLCLFTLGIFALDGLRRGLILGALDLLALVVTLALAGALYVSVGEALLEFVDLPAPIANLVAFVALLAIGQVVYAIGAAVLAAALAQVLAAIPPVRLLDALLGVVPGFVKGAIILAVVATTLRALPMASDIRRLLDGSPVLTQTVPLGAAVVPDLPALLGRLGVDATVVAPPPQAAAPPQRAVAFPPNLASEIDPESEGQMLTLLNRERVQVGLGALVVDERLREAARGHSQEMFRLSYFAHESPVVGSPFDRMLRAGARFSLAGENLAYAPTVESAHRGLMNSPDHRKNILTPGFRRVGIGVARASGWGRMFTQNFAD